VLIGLVVAGGVLAWFAVASLETPQMARLKSNDLLVDYPGIDQPAFVTSADANITDETVVIGISYGDEYRAYALHAMNDMQKHIVNDTLDGLPVSVVYCDIDDCIRVFAGEAGADALPLRVGGYHGRFYDGSMLLKLGDNRYRLDTGANLYDPRDVLPYDYYPYERTTWGAWRVKHPGSALYKGDRLTAQ
jgi:hypothetical protein